MANMHDGGHHCIFSEPTWSPSNRPEAAPVTTAVPVANATEIIPPVSAMAVPMGACSASQNNECVVCFGKNVDTCLRPCGHIAMCRNCAASVRKCPICRAPISSIDPIPVASATIPVPIPIAAASEINAGGMPTTAVPMATAVLMQ